MKRIAAVVWLVVFLAACSSAVGVYTAEDDGASLELNVGDTFDVRLEGNPTTGFTWQVLPSEDPVCALIGEPQFLESAPRVGAPGDFVFTFEAITEGTEDLTLVYRRPWEDTEPLATMNLLLDVSG